MDQDLAVFATTARILTRAAGGEADADLVRLAQERALDAAVFEQFPPFTWRNQISSTRLDSYWTHMDPETSLPNFAEDAAEGRAFLIGHNSREMPMGATLTGEVRADGSETAVYSGAYTLTEPATEAFRNRVRAGIQRDVSVGFSGPIKFLCSVCGRDMWRDWSCPHIPGFEYVIDDPEEASGRMLFIPTPGGGYRLLLATEIRALGKKVTILCTAKVVDARLSEVSAVYDGATPGAAILQAERQARAGALEPAQLRLLESRYRIRLPDATVRAVVPALPQHEENPMPPEEEEAGRQAGATTADETALPAEEERLAARVAELETALTAARAEIAQLTPIAEDGGAWRAELMTQLEAEGVRALGSGFNAETYRSLLERATIAQIREVIAGLTGKGDQRFSGGRKTEDPPEQPAKPEQPARRIAPPAGAFRAD